MNSAVSGNTTLPLLFGHTESSLQCLFEERLGRPVMLRLTDNSTSMLSARMRDNILCVRLHRMFANADARVIDEIVSFLKKKRDAMPLFRKYVRERADELRQRPLNRIAARTQGKVYDLASLYCEVNAEYFDNRVDALITWGSSSSRNAVRKRTLGSYSERSHVIRINPVLDKKTVPRYVVAFVVYHEMLHAAIGIVRKNGRRSAHSREFRTREKLFKDYEKAAAWERIR